MRLRVRETGYEVSVRGCTLMLQPRGALQGSLLGVASFGRVHSRSGMVLCLQTPFSFVFTVLAFSDALVQP